VSDWIVWLRVESQLARPQWGARSSAQEGIARPIEGLVRFSTEREKVGRGVEKSKG